MSDQNGALKRTKNILFLCAAAFLCTVVLGSELVARADGQRVVAWTYYIFPPFVLENGKGLTHDFIELLNQQAQGRFSFHLEVMPKRRIEMNLDMHNPGIVLFVNPAWMNLTDTLVARWTPTLFHDRNVIISNVARKVDFEGAESVRGLKLGGVFGRKYLGLEGLIEEGFISRDDAGDEEVNVRKLSRRRIDFMTAPESVLRFLVNRLGVEDVIYFSPKPIFEYTRHILLMKLVNDLPSNADWLAIKEKYRLNQRPGQ